MTKRQNMKLRKERYQNFDALDKPKVYNKFTKIKNK